MPHLLLVDDDDDFRKSLGLNLIDEGYEVTSFDNGRDALAYLEHGGGADAMLLDWRMPQFTGIEVLRNLRGRGIALPVIFLTALSDDIYEEAALAGGAVDFIDKSRRLPILVRRLRLITEGARPADDAEPPRPDALTLGRLELRFDIDRPMWAGDTVELTLTEFKILALAAERQGRTSAIARSMISCTARTSSPVMGQRGTAPMSVPSSSVSARSCPRHRPRFRPHP